MCLLAGIFQKPLITLFKWPENAYIHGLMHWGWGGVGRPGGGKRCGEAGEEAGGVGRLGKRQEEARFAGHVWQV